MKFLFILAVGWIFFRLLRPWFFARDNHARAFRPMRASTAAGTEVHTVRCAYCGAFFSPDEGVDSGGRHFCSREHRDLEKAAGEHRSPC